MKHQSIDLQLSSSTAKSDPDMAKKPKKIKASQIPNKTKKKKNWDGVKRWMAKKPRHMHGKHLIWDGVKWSHFLCLRSNSNNFCKFKRICTESRSSGGKLHDRYKFRGVHMYQALFFQVQKQERTLNQIYNKRNHTPCFVAKLAIL